MNNLLSKIKKGPTKLPPKIMLIGVEGVGKSTAGASMPNPIFICGESGLVGPQFDGIPNFTPESWKDILDFCDELATTPGEANGCNSCFFIWKTVLCSCNCRYLFSCYYCNCLYRGSN